MFPATSSRALSAREAVSLTLRTALEHHERGRLSEAAALYREVLGIQPGNLDSIFLLGLIALAVKNHLAAERLLSIAAERMPKAAFAHRALGEALTRLGRWGAALDSYWRALKTDPQNAGSYVDVAEALIAMKPDGGNDEQAAACFRQALRVDASLASAHAGLGHIHLRRERPAAAEESYRAAIAFDEYCAGYHNALGASLFRQQRYSVAADAYRHALTLQPRSPEIYLNLGNALRALGDRDRAEACYRRALHLRPQYPRAMHQLVTLMSEGEENASALQCYREVAAAEPGLVNWARAEV
jgi:protein O-GlcNAc transferase